MRDAGCGESVKSAAAVPFPAPASSILEVDQPMLHQLILFAFGFGNLAMLGWLAAAAAPLLIHLWSRHRFREAPWAAMQFLLAAMRKNARRLQLQQWLLLAVRTLIILLVVLAVAEPYGERLLAGGSADAESQGARDRRFVFDGLSRRMAKRISPAPSNWLARWCAASRPGDVFTVIHMASPPKLVVGAEVFDRAAVDRAESNRSTQPQAGADLAGNAAHLCKRHLPANDGPKLPEHKGSLFLHRSAAQHLGRDSQAEWPAAIRKKSSQSGIRNCMRSQSGRSLTVIDLGRPKAANLAVTECLDIRTGRHHSVVILDSMRRSTIWPRSQRAQCRVELAGRRRAGRRTNGRRRGRR